MVAPTIDTREWEAVIFDTDGVITDTASIHAAAWKRTFDTFLRARADRLGERFCPFTDEDYRQYVDGKPRYNGVWSFLQSRSITLPYGAPDDPPTRDTVCAIGNRKNEDFLQHLAGGVRAYPSSVEVVRRLRSGGVRTAVISASENAAEVLGAAGVSGLFDTRVDGRDAARLCLAGKPDPDIFLEAARRLGVDPSRAVVVEDALAGVEAGRRGGFGLVVGWTGPVIPTPFGNTAPTSWSRTWRNSRSTWLRAHRRRRWRSGRGSWPKWARPDRSCSSTMTAR